MSRDEELILDQDEMQRLEHMRREKRERLAEICKLAESREGLRFLCVLLREMGVCRPVGGDAGEIALHNFGMGILAALCQVNPKRAAKALAFLHGLEGSEL